MQNKQAYWEAEHHAEAKRAAKRREAVIKRWTKLIHGLRIRERLQEQYADRRDPEQPTERGGFVMEEEEEEKVCSIMTSASLPDEFLIPDGISV